jgi:hypothetical protein
MRLQCAYRKKQARRRLEEQMKALVDAERAREDGRRHGAASRIQARTRGGQGRAKFVVDRRKLEDSKVIRGALQRMRARQRAEMHKIEARMRHLEKFGPSEYLWSGVRSELPPPAVGAHTHLR